MKTNYLMGVVMTSVLAAGMSACSDNGDEPGAGQDVKTASGFYTVNGGNMSGNIPASITSYSFDSGEGTPALEDAFYKANGIALGDGAQQAVTVGDNMFIAMYSSNLIWAVDPQTLTVKGSIRPEGNAMSPRYMAEANGKLYVSMYTGYVCEIDPESLTVTRTVQVGPNPEQLAVAGNRLVVACSDGMNYMGSSTDGVPYGDSCLSFIDLSTFTATNLKDLDKILNPTYVSSNGSDVFVVCMGVYGDPQHPNQVVKVKGNDVENVCPGTFIDLKDNDLYVIYSQSGGTEDITYKKYDATSLTEKGDFAKRRQGTDSWIDVPNGVFVNPYGDEVVVLSYVMGSAGWGLYREPCYANVYSASTGDFQNRVECGVGACGVTFIGK
ncbi:MAG: hypothetical protein HDR80_03625 [Bacteroides sp.]|nr:hypothetical protein [Bacteroides sp.]